MATGLTSQSFGPQELKTYAGSKSWLRTESSGWTSLISAKNLMKFTSVETIPSQWDGKAF